VEAYQLKPDEIDLATGLFTTLPAEDGEQVLRTTISTVLVLLLCLSCHRFGASDSDLIYVSHTSTGS